MKRSPMSIFEGVQLPEGWNPESTFLMKVTGDHLEDAAIIKGDYVLVRHGQTGRAGDIVVVLDRLNSITEVKHCADADPANIIGIVSGVLRVIKQ